MIGPVRRVILFAREPVAGAPSRVTAADGIAADELALDIGPDTIAEYARRLRSAGTIYWNGSYTGPSGPMRSRGGRRAMERSETPTR